MIPSIASWLPYLSTSVGHVPFTGQDDFGATTTTSTGTWYPAHVEDALIDARGGQISVVSARLHIIIGAVVRIDPRDRLMVLSPFVSKNSTGVFSTQENAQVVRVSPSMAPVFGQHHTEVWTE